MIESEELKLDGTRLVDFGGSFSAFANQYEDSGVIYLGRINGIDFWEYGQSVLEEDGTEIPLIREKYIEFVSRAPKAQNMRRLYYAPIMDIRAIRDGRHMTKRYTFSKMQDDPSTWVQWMKTRPLPLPKRPDWNISFKAVSG